LIDPRQVDLAHVHWSEFDVAFLALHGTFGEDGEIQALLEGWGVPYTGSNSETSRLAFSKSAAKERFLLSAVPTPAYVLIHESDDATRIERQAKKLGYPLVVKPDSQGSSLGVSIVRSPDELPRALTRCFHYDRFGILERFVDGTEWTVGLLDQMVLPPIQIETPRGFFDYEAKYADDATQYVFDSDVPPHAIAAIAEVGHRAAEVLGTQGMARVDIRLDKYLQPWVLEVNTIPGMTSHSLVPKAAARIGIEFGELCERTIQSCLVPAGSR
jgi:D-alanine-D-alanine ligase